MQNALERLSGVMRFSVIKSAPSRSSSVPGPPNLIIFSTMLALLYLAAALVFAADAIHVSSHIASSMVVQRAQPFRLQGIDVRHAKLTATLFAASYTATADANGHFSITIPAQQASTSPTTIGVISSSGATVRLSDVLFGDVYISSGQSNMGPSVAMSPGATTMPKASRRARSTDRSCASPR